MRGAPRILLVEDDRLSRQIFSDWLREFGYGVETADSAEAALAQLSTDTLDLVVTDLLLPGRDGVALLADAQRLNPDVDVIVITALDHVAPAVRALKAGAADYLVKPLSKEALEVAVSRCLSARQLSRENQALRDQVGLFERGRRVSATLEPSELWPLALSTLAEAVGAKAGVLAGIDPHGRTAMLSQVQLAASRARELLDRCGSQIRSALTEPKPRWLDAGDVPGWSAPLVLVPCPHQGEVRCMGALVLESLPKPSAREALDNRAQYLAKHVGLAHANTARFTKAEALARTDDLTGLYNDRALRSEIDRLIAIETQQPFSLVFLDLDYFKVINDAHGHLIGSRVLAEMGRVLRGVVRDIDLASRYGGDEFAIVLPGSDSGEALQVAERVRRAIQDHPFADGIRLTASIGVACHPEHGKDRDTLLTMADAAMYRGKRGQRNIVYLAAPPR